MRKYNFTLPGGQSIKLLSLDGIRSTLENLELKEARGYCGLYKDDRL